MADNAKPTPEELLEQLKKEGIHSLEDLAKVASEKIGAASTAESVFITPHFVGSH